MTTTDTSSAFVAPGPGQWLRLADHFPRALTAEYQRLYAETCPPGTATYMERYGVLARTLDAAYVRGHLYVSAVPLIGPRQPRSAPPRVGVWLLSRIVPVFRRRNGAARRTLAQRPWRAVAQRWFDVERDQWCARAAALEAIDAEHLDDTDLAEHLRVCRALVAAGYLRHFELHGDDLLPLGLLITRCREWGIDPAAATAALAGSTTAPHASEVSPWMLVTGYDLDCFTWGELRVPAGRSAPPPPAPVDLRARVAAEHHEELAELISDARHAARLRDDNGAITAAWPMGLLRRAMLVVGRRHLPTAPDLAVEATVDELLSVLGGRPTVTETDLRRRRTTRHAHSALDAPLQLGSEFVLPPLDALPRPLRLIAAAQLAVAEHTFTGATTVGVGNVPYTGRAVVVDDPIAAFALIEPGDIIVTTATSPAWNTILARAGALVTTSGGFASHAAITARELGIPAVLGDRTACQRLHTGLTVTVDPTCATVTVIADAQTPPHESTPTWR